MSMIKIEGLSDLKKALQELPVKIEKNIMRGALRSGAKEFETKAKEEMPEQSGKLKRSLKINTRVRKGVVTSTISVGGGKVFYAHMVEFGTVAHLIKPKKKKSLVVNGTPVASAQHPGAIGKPFMRPAFDAGSADAVQAVAEYIKKRLDKEAAKK